MSPRARTAAGRGLCNCAVVALTGSIGTLLAAPFVIHLRTRGKVREVRVVMTESAAQFVTPMAMRAVSGTPVLTGLFDPDAPLPVGHTQIVDGADVMIVMPATANIIGKAANGIADDAVSASILAAACPVVFVPNMSPRMWANPAVQRNIRTLKSDGHHVVPTVDGVEITTLKLRKGGMPEFDDILDAVRRVLRSS
jgi:phosphopantothenoylcysteine decarboxylase/phosphopantothenate--cysteine ligase